MNVLEMKATVTWKEVFVPTLKEIFSALVMKDSQEMVLQEIVRVSTACLMIYNIIYRSQ